MGGRKRENGEKERELRKEGSGFDVAAVGQQGEPGMLLTPLVEQCNGCCETTGTLRWLWSSCFKNSPRSPRKIDKIKLTHQTKA